ncbi:hypothetical protein NDU88_004126 [Pleurodeles waltl]|uniref:Uncharacterized protein n=1 Tax=Pleurodeles waltl TaxID=8319 RepID=A0AAV7WWS7_PLEWA|nr:hypothetical protein NDU88_004126 [Pleurodeles waltl]
MLTKGRNRAKSQGWYSTGDMAQVDMTGPVPLSLQAMLDRILGAIEESKTSLKREIARVSVELGLLRVDHQKRPDRVQCTKTMLTDLAPAHQEIKATVLQLTDRFQRL